MKLIKLALRNLLRQKRRSILLGSAIAFGILFITLINGFTGSFIENVGENFSHLLAGHIFIDGVEKSPTGKDLNLIRDDSKIMDAIDDSGIEYTFLTKRSEIRGTLLFEGNGINQSIVGADWTAESYFKERIILKEGSFDNMSDPQALIISSKIADRLNVRLDDRVIVKMQTFTGQQSAGDFTIAAISIDTGLFGSISCYANINYVNELLNIGSGQYLTLGIYLPELLDTELATTLLLPELQKQINLFSRETAGHENPFLAILEQQEEEEWDGVRYRLTTINDILSEVEEIVRILNIAGLIIMLVLFAIIMVGITNTFRMVMFERIKEIGTMRAVGMHRSEVRALFLFEALFLALAGILAGYILSGLIMFIISRVYWGVDTPLFMLLRNGYMTFKLAPLQVLLNIVIVSLLTLLAAFRPADKAAKLEPALALAT
ncbi:MAG: ABC transporter permease, partial [Spirochaetales bacterium]|nr:ABC transporter permease [Spirochaetales bacterium]